MPGFAFDFIFFALTYAALVGIVLFRQFHQNSVVTSHWMDQSAPWGRYADAVVEAPLSNQNEASLHSAKSNCS